jgi:hypothetical protein
VFKISGQYQKEFSTEFKFLFQSNFFDDQLIFVTNLTPEIEFRKFDGDDAWESELAFEATAGLSYRFAPKWYAGLETRYHSEYPDWPDTITREHYAIFLGPNIHYGSEKWWFTLTALPQVFGTPNESERSAFRHLGEHEKLELRFKIGFNF